MNLAYLILGIKLANNGLKMSFSGQYMGISEGIWHILENKNK